MDVQACLAQIERLLAEARPVPLSASVMVSRKEFEESLADLRENLPEELRQSRWIIKERDEVLAQAEREAQQLLADARLQSERLISETDVIHQAQRQAEQILEEAREHARVLRLEAEDYVDGKLANFEIVLQKTLTAVEKGRERLRGRLATDELAEAEAEDAEDAASQFYDHETGPG